MNFGFTLIAVVFFNCFCDDGLVTGTTLPYAPVTQKPVPPTYVDPVVAKNLALCARTLCPLIYCANSLPAIPSQGICCPRCVPPPATESPNTQSSSSSSSSEEKKDKDSDSKEKKNKSGSGSSEKKDSKSSSSDSSEEKKNKGGSSKEKKSKGGSKEQKGGNKKY